MLGRNLTPSGFRGRLLLIFLAISTLPLLATSLAFFFILNASVETETFAKLSFVRDAKRSEISQYLTFAVRQAETLSKSNAVRYAIGDFYGFSYAFRQIDPSPERATSILQQIFRVDDPSADHLLPSDKDALIRSALEYANAHTQFHDSFADFISSSEFDNVYLVTPGQRVVYSVQKDRYLGMDLITTMAGTGLAQALRILTEAPAGTNTVVRDFEWDPIAGEYAAYVATRVEFYDKVRGTVVYRLPATGLDRLVQSQNNATGSLYLLSSHAQLISAPANGSLAPGSAVIPARPGPVTTSTALVETGIGGGAALSAWAPIDFLNQSWTLVAEVPNAQAFANSEQLKRIVLGLGTVTLPVLFILVLYLARTMTAPLQALTDATQSIASGDLDRAMPDIRKPSELARLSRSFARMRDAIREQLDLIGQKNRELENQVSIIAEKNIALEEADRLKDTFLANTSHELRTPLNGIIGISETLTAGAAGELSAEQRSQMQLITFSARRLSRLVDDLLDLYRIRQGRMRLDIHPVHVATSVRDVLQLSEPLLRGEPVTLEVDIPESLPFVLADPVRFEQILYNLLGNAIKYTERGTIQIVAEAEGDMVAVSVQDTGLGISPENLERIFQPLEQAVADDPARKSVGTGLGLTIARQLATILNGNLLAQSTLGKGSRFTVRLPAASMGAVVPLDDAQAGPDGWQESIDMLWRADATQELPLSSGAPLILVVDDEPINIQVLRNVLQPQGYVVRSADSGLAALDFVEHSRPDLIVLDVMMPQMSGLEVAKRIRDRYSLHTLPIIMVTARSRTRDIIAGFEHGANDYVVKPFVKDELLARIATLLEAGRARGRARENMDLRSEIQRRVQVEEALLLSQQRMTRILDTLQAGLICVSDAGVVTYCNPAALGYLDKSLEIGVTQIDDLLPALAYHRLRQLVIADGQAVFDGIAIGEPPQPCVLHAFEIEADAGGGIALVFSGSDQQRDDPQGLVRSVMGVIDAVGPGLTHTLQIERASDEPGDTAPEEVVDRDSYRRSIVEVMNLSLALWRRSTGASKMAFAERSRVWRVTLDRSSLQSRTFDKYLLIETLPANPRWRDVVQTAEFALTDSERYATESGELEALRIDLRLKLDALRDLVRTIILRSTS